MQEPTLPVQERSRRTRIRLLAASAARLVMAGLGGFSTGAVAADAGLSQGALFKHFPTKAHLLADTVAALLETSFDVFEHALGKAPDALAQIPLTKRVPLAIGALWTVFRGAELRAVFEVFVAARTDPALDERLAPVLTAHSARIHDVAKRIFHELADDPESPAVVDSIIFAMQGAAIGLFGSALRDDAKNLALFERLAHRELVHLSSSATRTPERGNGSDGSSRKK